MKLAIKSLTSGNKEEIDDIKHVFLTKKGQLVAIVNGLKKKLNAMNENIKHENEIKD